ncbi:MAG: hypothetical protein WCU88_00650 [Elusimicrobiota bacterium]|jgi:uncharacterized protein involved in outer membrane biogenesis
MKKILLYCAGGCLAVFIIAAAVIYIKLGSIVKTAVETLGPKVTRTEVRLNSVVLSPFSGSGRIRGLFIGNPAGYKTPGAFEFRSVRLSVDLKSLGSDRVVIREIVVDGLEVTLEGSLSGSNLSRIQKNAESFFPSSPKSEKPRKETKVEIGLFKATNGKVNLSAFGSESLSVPLPDIELRDIGRKSGGATIAEAAKEMFGALTGSAIKAASGTGSFLKSGTKDISDAGKAAAGMVQGLFGKKKE